MTSQPHLADEGRVLLFPATRRDGDAICAILDREFIHCLVCTSAAQVATELAKGAATLVLTDSALVDSGGIRIYMALQQQPQWSDLPVVLLRKSDSSPEAENMIARMSNVTVLERP